VSIFLQKLIRIEVFPNVSLVLRCYFVGC